MEFDQFYIWFKDNVSWIKDFAWIIFTAVATLIAIKTYKNAKKTLFQPLNSEVIKAQKDLFIEIYHLIKNDFFINIDYDGVFDFEFFGALNDIGYDICISEDFEKEYNELINNGFHLVSRKLSENEINEEKSILLIHQEANIIDAPPVDGEAVEVMFLQISKKSQNLIDKLNELANDPLLPTEFKDKMNNLISSIHYNFVEVMMPILSLVINEIWFSEHLTDDEIINIRSDYYNHFVETAIDHNQEINEIYSYINNYLKVDELFK